MNKKPKILASLILMLALIAALAGCSGGNAPEVPAESGVTNGASDTTGTTQTPDASPDDNDAEELQREADYEAAKEMLESGDFIAASSAFAALADYKDSGELQKEADYLAATENGQSVIAYLQESIYFEDETGLYIGSELVIKYPIILGETFGDRGYEVVSVNETVTTEAGVFENVVGIRDVFYNTEYYAPGVGHIKHQGIRSNGELFSISQ